MSRSANEQDKPKVMRAIAWGHKHGLRLNDLYYDEELANADGASFWIFTTAETPNEQVEEAIRDMYGNHDVVDFSIIRIPQAWIDEALQPIQPVGDIIDKVRAIADGEYHNHSLTWPDKQSLHIDPTTANLLIKVFDASDERTQQNIRKASNMSLNKFTRVIDIAWKCVA